MNVDLLEVVSTYILEPEKYWLEDNSLSTRSRIKVEKVRAALGVENKTDVQKKIIPILELREKKRTPTVFALSRGGSGCHFLGDVLETNPKYKCVGEVYFPPRVIEFANFADQRLKRLVLDFVSFLPTVVNGQLLVDTIPVNVMHLTDTALVQILRENLIGAKFFALIRNPYDITYSLTYRKNAYRKSTSPNSTDIEYGISRARMVERFFNQLDQVQWDCLVRYEDLVARPVEVCEDALFLAGLSSSKLQNLKLTSTNYNASERMEMEARLGQAIFKHLSIPAATWRYTPPPYIRFPDLTDGKYWKPMETELSSKDLLVAKHNMQAIVARNLEPINVFDQIDSIDFESKTLTWKMYFWTLCWLDQCKDFPNGNELQLSWFLKLSDLSKEYCLEPEKAPDGYWDDHATAYRSAMLLFLFHKFYDQPEVRKRHRSFSFIFIEHYKNLESYYLSKKWKGNNHSIFHLMAQINLVNSCEYISSSGSDKSKQINILVSRLRTAIGEIIDLETGISREQSFHYHCWSISLLKRVDDLVTKLNLAPEWGFEEIIGKMFDFAEKIILPGATCPAIGDTPYSNSYDENLLKNRVKYKRGSTNKSFEKSIIKGPDNEFAIIRQDDSQKQESSLLLMTGFRERHSHGHHDTLSVWFSEKNRPILIDSGGPFLYGNKTRFEYFVQSKAHNTVIVNKNNYTGGGELNFFQHDEEFSVLRGVIEHNNGARHSRVCILEKNSCLIIVDKLTSLTGVKHRFDALFHLSPDFRAQRKESIGESWNNVHGVTLKSDVDVKTMYFLCSADDDADLRITSGDQDQDYQSWVTRKQGEKEENECIIFGASAKECFLVSILEGEVNYSNIKIDDSNALSLIPQSKFEPSIFVDLDALFFNDIENVANIFKA